MFNNLKLDSSLSDEENDLLNIQVHVADFDYPLIKISQTGAFSKFFDNLKQTFVKEIKKAKMETYAELIIKNQTENMQKWASKKIKQTSDELISMLRKGTKKASKTKNGQPQKMKSKRKAKPKPKEAKIYTAEEYQQKTIEENKSQNKQYKPPTKQKVKKLIDEMIKQGQFGKLSRKNQKFDSHLVMLPWVVGGVLSSGLVGSKKAKAWELTECPLKCPSFNEARKTGKQIVIAKKAYKQLKNKTQMDFSDYNKKLKSLLELKEQYMQCQKLNCYFEKIQ